MFLSSEQPEGRETETHPWVGKYRGGYMAIERRLGGSRRWDAYYNKAFSGRAPHLVLRIENVRSVKDGLHRLKCIVDWELWQREWRAPAREVHRIVRGRIDYELAEGYKLGKWGFMGMIDDVTEWLESFRVHDSAPLGWWNSRTIDQKLAFVTDIWTCSGRKLPAGVRQPAAAPKKEKPVEKAKPKPAHEPMAIQRQTAAVLQRPFGHCKRCKVCLAFDVNHGCCTVCGRQLTPNPVRRKRSKTSRKGAKKRKDSRAAALRRLMRM